ncbi:MAG: hypothetical protein WHS88_07330 [Anaerohalosphaeraceae bacterium]
MPFLSPGLSPGAISRAQAVVIRAQTRVLPAQAAVIPAQAAVIPAQARVLPAQAAVIPAQAGIQAFPATCSPKLQRRRKAGIQRMEKSEIRNPKQFTTDCGGSTDSKKANEF